MTKRSSPGKERAKRVEKNWLEWVVFGLGLALVGGTLGYLVYAGVTMKGAPPDITVTLGEPRKVEQGFVVPVTVFNRGDETAEGVSVEVALEDVPEPERGEFQIAFLPRHAKREAWVAFRTDPAKGRLTPRVLGYERP